MRKIRSGTASSVTCKANGSVEIIAPGGILNAAGGPAVVVDADIASVTVLANTAQTTANTAQTTANSAISDASAAQTTANAAVPTATKDATGGVAGLTLFRINFKNAANTFTSFFTNAATAARTYTFPDKDITVAGLVDITGTNSGTNTGDNATNTQYSGTVSNATHTGDATGATALTIAANAVTNAKAAQMATKTYKGRTSALTGDSEDVAVATLKADLALVKADVGLAAVDNVQQLPLSYLDTDINLAANSDAKVPSQKAIKAYTDALMQGLYPKASVRAISTTNITLSGAQTIDGVSIIAGDRVLVAGQTTGANNGIYLCAAGAWTRATDADVSAEVKTGIFTFVSEGTANADSGWTLITNDPITLGTTALVFTQFSGAGQITAGAALTKSGNTLDVAVDGVGIEINADALRLKDAGVALTKLANMATSSLIYRRTAAAGVPEVNTLAQLKTDLAFVENATHTGDVTGATALTITANAASNKPREQIIIAVSDEGTNLTVGAAKVTFRLGYAFTITEVRASVNTASAGSTIIVDINEAGTSIMTTTKLSIDAAELTSTTAAALPVLTDTTIADDAAITIDIDQVGSTTAGKGLRVLILGFRT